MVALDNLMKETIGKTYRRFGIRLYVMVEASGDLFI